jgi:CheY-like chemotaxis protein
MGRSGSGLGLAVVYGVVKDFGGYIDVKSKRGEGTQFDLYLPATHESVAEEESPETDYCGTESILVVDDLPQQRELAARLLESLGYRVAKAENGMRAVEMIREQTVDLVVLDMIMDEGFDGLDTYRKIRQIRPSQACVIASGFSESERVRAAQSLGAGEFIHKPYTRDNIGRVVRRALDAK